MSIDNFAGTFILACDICGEELPQTFDDFYEAVDYKKSHGWRSKKDDDWGWQDVCPDCQKADWEDD